MLRNSDFAPVINKGVEVVNQSPLLRPEEGMKVEIKTV